MTQLLNPTENPEIKRDIQYLSCPHSLHTESTISKIQTAVILSRQSSKIKNEALKEIDIDQQNEFEKKIDQKLEILKE